MAGIATKAVGCIYYEARMAANVRDDVFSSTDKAAEVVGINRSRLARIEEGHVEPTPEDVAEMARAYGTPHLLHAHCSTRCPVGRGRMPAVDHAKPIERTVLTMAFMMGELMPTVSDLTGIFIDGVVDEHEREVFQEAMRRILEQVTVGLELLMWTRANHPELLPQV